VQLELNGTLTPAFASESNYTGVHTRTTTIEEKRCSSTSLHISRSGSAGHYAFVSLKPGVYDVRIQLEHCWAPAKHAHTERIVSVECRDDSQRQKYRLDSIVLEHHDRKRSTSEFERRFPSGAHVCLYNDDADRYLLECQSQ